MHSAKGTGVQYVDSDIGDGTKRLIHWTNQDALHENMVQR